MLTVDHQLHIDVV